MSRNRRHSPTVPDHHDAIIVRACPVTSLRCAGGRRGWQRAGNRGLMPVVSRGKQRGDDDRGYQSRTAFPPTSLTVTRLSHTVIMPAVSR